MKDNVQLMDTATIAKEVADYLSAKNDTKIVYKVDSCYLEKNGDFHLVVWDDATNAFSQELTFTGNDIAYMVDQPLWEVVSVDAGGFDELALLMFEEV